MGPRATHLPGNIAKRFKLARNKRENEETRWAEVMAREKPRISAAALTETKSLTPMNEVGGGTASLSSFTANDAEGVIYISRPKRKVKYDCRRIVLSSGKVSSARVMLSPCRTKYSMPTTNPAIFLTGTPAAPSLSPIIAQPREKLS
jgi:hypothetical protein